MSTTLAQISARCASSLIKKLSGSDTAKFIKFGVTTKGQPWIVYQVGDRKCSHFVSKKEWDFAKDEVFFVSETRVASDTISPNTTPYLSGLYSVINLRKKSAYDVSYYRRSETTPAITNCGCVAGQFKKSCKHQLLIKHLGDRSYDSLLEKRSPRPVPVSAPTPADYIHPAQKEADRVWAANEYRITGNSLKLDNNSIYVAGVIRRAGAAQTKYVIESASYGTFLINTEYVEKSAEISQSVSQPVVQASSLEIARRKFDEIWDSNQDFIFVSGRKGKRVSSLICDTYNPYGTGYMIFELNDCNLLVKKATEPVPPPAGKVPSVVASKVSEIRSEISRRRPVAVATFPDIFGGAQTSTEVVWEFAGSDTWRSSLGGSCFSAALESNVRADLSLGLRVVCRTTKAAYLCSLSCDGKILKSVISQSA